MKYLGGVIIGGIIGYFTNWLAIKMLFRPYEEKYIFGIKLPFTPGLIPKEQKRIAKNIGITIEEYLLSPEAIVRFIDKSRLEDKINSQIESYLTKLKDEDLSLEDFINRLGGRSYYDNVELVSGKVSNYLINELRETKNLRYIEEEIVKFMENKDIKEAGLKAIDLVVDKAFKGGELDLLLREFIISKKHEVISCNKLLGEVIPKEVSEGLDSYLDENKKIIAYRLREEITSPNIKPRLKGIIGEMVEKNVSKLITAFAPMDIIVDKIYLALIGYIKGDRWADDVNSLIKSLVEDLMDKEVSKSLGEILNNIDGLDDGLVKIIKNNLSKLDTINYIEKIIGSINKDEVSKNIREALGKYFSSHEFNLLINSLIFQSILSLGRLDFNYILESFNIDSLAIFNGMDRLYRKLIEPKMEDIIGLLNIGKIAERTINEFEFDFLEKLILDIAEKELKAITRLGGLLGGIIGLLSPFIQML